jgi:3-dehydroquinate synthetase
MAFRFSERLQLCPEGSAARVANHLATARLPTSPAAIAGNLPDAGGLLAIMRQDKKAQAGKLTFILVRNIGEAFIARDIPDEKVLAFLGKELAGR